MALRNAAATFKVVGPFTNGLPSLSPPGQKPNSIKGFDPS